MDLPDLTASYLESAGYTAGKRGRDLVIGTKPSAIGQETESVLVWVPAVDARNPFRAQEASYLERFARASHEYLNAQRFMLIPSFEGISTEFRSGAKRWHNVNLRVPIQFFDTPFKGEDSPGGREASAALAVLRKEGEEIMPRRVAQPYSTYDGRQVGDDLLSVLQNAVSSNEGGKSVHIVVGPAGIGKTVLFKSLFSKLLSDFLEDKSNLRLAPRPRPLPLTPEYIRYSVAPTVKALVDAFLATEFAASITRGVFEWMITNGFGVWLVDGLDEVIARDPAFFEYLLDLLTRPGGGPPKIVICVRDSLLATNDDIRDFIEEYRNVVGVYELAKWQLSSKRRFATIALRDKADGFIELIGKRPEIDELSATPYYCQLLADLYKSDSLQEAYTESQLLQHAVSAIIQREYGKGLLDKDLIPETTVTEFLEALAAEDLEEGFQGIPREAIEEWARIVLPSDLTAADLQRLITHVVQLAVFSHGSLTGNVQFSQEIIQRYLLGAYLSRRLSDNSDAFVRALAAREIPGEWVTLKVVAEQVRTTNEFPALVQLALQVTDSAAFRNLVQVAALSASNPNDLRALPFERRDLSGITFNGFDFNGVSFRAADLTDVEFTACNLRNTVFEEAIIKNTKFQLPEKDSLNGASFGQMERFYSLRTGDGKVIVDPPTVSKWLSQQTAVKSAIVEPCAAARQLRYMFGKFVYPDGTARRAMLDGRGVLSGRRIYDSEDVLKAALKYGYLLEEERFRRIKRPDGDSYSEIVAFVRDLTLAPGLRSLLSDICDRDGCPHVPLVTSE